MTAEIELDVANETIACLRRDLADARAAIAKLEKLAGVGKAEPGCRCANNFVQCPVHDRPGVGWQAR